MICPLYFAMNTYHYQIFYIVLLVNKLYIITNKLYIKYNNNKYTPKQGMVLEIHIIKEIYIKYINI